VYVRSIESPTLGMQKFTKKFFLFAKKLKQKNTTKKFYDYKTDVYTKTPRVQPHEDNGEKVVLIQRFQPRL